MGIPSFSGRYHRHMTMNRAALRKLDRLDEPAAAHAAACLFRGMSDPSRVAILQHLLLGERNVTELTEHLGLAQSTVSQHLACLRDCGLVESRPVGRSSLFELTQPQAVLKVFAAAEELLAGAGAAVVLCRAYGEGATQ